MSKDNELKIKVRGIIEEFNYKATTDDDQYENHIDRVLDKFAEKILQAFSEELDELEGKLPELLTDGVTYDELLADARASGYRSGHNDYREKALSAIKEMKERIENG